MTQGTKVEDQGPTEDAQIGGEDRYQNYTNRCTGLDLFVIQKTDSMIHWLLCQREWNQARTKHAQLGILKDRPLTTVEDDKDDKENQIGVGLQLLQEDNTI